MRVASATRQGAHTTVPREKRMSKPKLERKISRQIIVGSAFPSSDQGPRTRSGVIQEKKAKLMRSRSKTTLSLGNWEKLFDPENNAEYYYNKLSGVTQWEKPEGFEQENKEEALELNNSKKMKLMRGRSKKILTLGDWQKFIDPESNTEYYYNEATGQTQWHVPKEFAQSA